MTDSASAHAAQEENEAGTRVLPTSLLYGAAVGPFQVSCATQETAKNDHKPTPPAQRRQSQDPDYEAEEEEADDKENDHHDLRQHTDCQDEDEEMAEEDEEVDTEARKKKSEKQVVAARHTAHPGSCFFFWVTAK